MRKLFLALAVGAALSLALAAPAVAEPEQNPSVLTYQVTCDGDSWTVIARGTPGWAVEGSAGTTPDLLVGGHFTLTIGSDVFTWHDPLPPGLASMVQTCRVEGPLEPTGFHLVIAPAYIMLTPH